MMALAIITPFAYYLSKIVFDEVLKLHDVKLYIIPEHYANFQWHFVFNRDWFEIIPKKIFNYLLSPYVGTKWYIVFGFIIVPIFFIKSLLTYIRSWKIHSIGHRIICDFQRELYDKFLKLPLSFYNSAKTGDISSRIISDVYRTQEVVTDIILQVLQQSLIVIGTVSFLLWMSPLLALISFVGVPFALAPIILTGRYLKKKSKLSQEETANINSHIFETVSAIKIIKIFNKETHENNSFNQAIDKLLKILLKTAKIATLSSPLVEFLSTLIVTGFISLGCFYLIESNKMTPGDFLAFVILVYSLYDPLRRLGRMNDKIANGFAALDRMIEIYSLKSELDDHKGTNQLPELTTGITFKNLSFKYQNENVLNDINFSAPKGKSTAIVGISGSGKTTLVNLLPSFFELQVGDILFDDSSLKNVTLQSLRNQIALVSQEVILFNQSIEYNIGYGKENFTKDDVVIAAKKANAHEFIMELPNGYESQIGERGAKLSGGQRQRISIARALLSDKPILILDEATSALDVQSEKLIQEALNNLMKNKTTFVIAHRLSTIQNADQIIVLNSGSIESIGTHEELMKSDGTYKSLYTTMMNS